ncbi:hypothetical protein [Neobacillus massiliamazoniensis]|jgi:hypothetical protein|uniref:Uncharacterized protein n=1 Tax=Neobacillus massiliamazoniensis TaxID=1499688 RepID=A0A0U1NQ81_9BACI|nr:hypothetical protein [Neobacillus massiliamazoniensis]CRK80203.1 hypothetical protein BN000_00084 [Neobacillus massiliamazoniensis]
MSSPILSPTFHIGTIKIGSIEGASCFSIGNNFIEDFKSSKRHNQGLGNIHGDRNNLSHTSASLTNCEHEPMKKKPLGQKSKNEKSSENP